MTFRLAALALAAAAAASPAAAQATLDIEVCNRSRDNAVVAVSYQPIGSGGWLNQGWYGVARGTCRIVARTGNAYFYLYAEVDGDSSRFWGGNHQLCVEYPGPYEFWTPSNNTCARHQETAGFVTLNAQRGGVYTWNLDP